MSDDIEGLETVDLPHPFETELFCLVTANHQIALDGIAQQEEKMVSHLEQSLQGENADVVSSIVSGHRNFYEDLRRALRNFSLVGVVTRFDHWISRLARQVSASNTRERSLLKKLRLLNDHIGGSPVNVEFFDEVVMARDAIIHNDSIADWEYRSQVRRVADRYVQYGEVYISDDDLSEAAQKAIAAVKWYDEKLNPLK